MTTKQSAPYGSWKSPITADLIVAETIGLHQFVLDGQDVYWTEMRPSEAGRYIIVRRSPDGSLSDVNPPPYSARTRVHEYGGGAFTVIDGRVYFSNFADQRLYRQKPGEPPEALSPEAPLRYADYHYDRARGRLLCVLEDHSDPDREAVNSLVSLDLETGEVSQVQVSGDDFYAAPRLSPDGSRLAWLAWNHPNMPWDGTELWVADLTADGALSNRQRIAGGAEESVYQPEWSPDGSLYFVSDRNDWWNLYRWVDAQVEPLLEMEAEFGRPQWVFDSTTYGFVSAERTLCTYTQDGVWHLASLDTHSGELQDIESSYTHFYGLKVGAGIAAYVAGSAAQATALVLRELDSGEELVLRRAHNLQIDPQYLSVPEPLEFPTAGGRTAYGLYYAPRNRDYQAPADEKPPLLVKSHGGPTTATGSDMRLGIQYWTSRGIAVLDVNYGGSTGYGRAFRQRLNAQWGVVDVQDCENGALFLVQRGDVDGERLAITGGSAGGYTTLCALTFGEVFKTGASYYGVSDLEALALDTHKFESRYLDSLVGPYPQDKDLYVARSPIHHSDLLSKPVVFFQGMDDKIVLPDQSERMAKVLKDKGLPVAYMAFEGEQHGFRQAENIKRSLEGELYFYARIFGFELAEPVEPLPIENL